MEENKDLLNEQEEFDEDDGVIYLTDEEGSETPFEFLELIDFEEKQYAVMPGGMAEPLDEFFTVPYAMPVTTVKELPAEALDPGTLQPTGLSVMVPAGEELTIFRTNAVDFADMSRPDGSCVRVSLDSAGWPRTIAGEDEAAYFEMLYYAG